MAKEQGISLNTSKVSGNCGRLLCCIKYEQSSYEQLLKMTPKNGAIVETAEGRGVVEDSNLLTGMLKVRLDNHPATTEPSMFHRRDVKLLRDANITVNKEELAEFDGLEGN